MKGFTKAAAIAAGLFLSAGAAQAQERSTTKQGFELPANSGKKILVFRPSISVGAQSTGGMFEPNGEWTEKARDNLQAALAKAQASLGNTVIVAPEAYGDDAPTLQEHIQLFAAVSDAVIQYQFFVGNRLPTKKRDNKNAVFDWSLGTGVAHLPGAKDADYGLFLFTQDAYGSTGRKMLQVFAAFGGVSVRSGVHKGYAGLVDLRTGDLLWLNADAEMGGDVREADGAEKRLHQLLEDFPGSTAFKAQTVAQAAVPAIAQAPTKP
ncbi:hypothetical protein [Sphingomonas sp.]|uniref:hypothetical protein n=1 Tax=Sphingomonas sp. TaxID=28214 RepID=UPI0028B07F67|nr:hypothetical protein [Sphingomonas sp.]